MINFTEESNKLGNLEVKIKEIDNSFDENDQVNPEILNNSQDSFTEYFSVLSLHSQTLNSKRSKTVFTTREKDEQSSSDLSVSDILLGKLEHINELIETNKFAAISAIDSEILEFQIKAREMNAKNRQKDNSFSSNELTIISANSDEEKEIVKVEEDDLILTNLGKREALVVMSAKEFKVDYEPKSLCGFVSYYPRRENSQVN